MLILQSLGLGICSGIIWGLLSAYTPSKVRAVIWFFSFGVLLIMSNDIGSNILPDFDTLMTLITFLPSSVITEKYFKSSKPKKIGV